jgi:hypothetical protein
MRNLAPNYDQWEDVWPRRIAGAMKRGARLVQTSKPDSCSMQGTQRRTARNGCARSGTSKGPPGAYQTAPPIRQLDSFYREYIIADVAALTGFEGNHLAYGLDSIEPRIFVGLCLKRWRSDEVAIIRF